MRVKGAGNKSVAGDDADNKSISSDRVNLIDLLDYYSVTEHITRYWKRTFYPYSKFFLREFRIGYYSIYSKFVNSRFHLGAIPSFNKTFVNLFGSLSLS